jgi:hypothetical protein
MLPESWKKEIDASIQETADRDAVDRAKKSDETTGLIASGLSGIAGKVSDYKEQQRVAEGRKSTRDWVTIGVIALTALLALGQGIVFYCQLLVFDKTDHTLNNTMIASDRAWVVPTGAHFDGQPKVGLNQRLKVTYENVGKEAASDVVVLAVWGRKFGVTIDGKQMPYIDFQTAPWPVNTTCSADLSRIINRRAVYPGTKNEFITYGFNDDPWFPQDVMDGKAFFSIFGCVIYRSSVTADRIHHSPYCLYLQPKRDEPIQNWTFEFCPSGTTNAD